MMFSQKLFRNRFNSLSILPFSGGSPDKTIRGIKEAQMAHQPKEMSEVLRWGGWRNPNPPDPWLELILEIGDPQIRQAAVSELVKMNIATARIQGEFWTGIQRAMGGKSAG
jgi:hypothetical protein